MPAFPVELFVFLLTDLLINVTLQNEIIDACNRTLRDILLEISLVCDHCVTLMVVINVGMEFVKIVPL